MEGVIFNPAIGSAFAPRRGNEPMKLPYEIMRERNEKRALIREEIRFKELCEKEKAGELNEDERQELKRERVLRFAEAFVSAPKVCYLA